MKSEKAFMGRWGINPASTGTAGSTPTATPLVEISGGIEVWVALRRLRQWFFFSLTLESGQPITKSTLAMLVGNASDEMEGEKK